MRISDWSSDVCSSDLSRELYEPTSVTGVTTRKPDGSSATGSPRRLAIVARCAASTTAATTRSLLSSSKAVPTGAVAIAATSDSSNTQPECKRSEEHTSKLQSLIRISYAVLWLKKKTGSATPERPRIPTSAGNG